MSQPSLSNPAELPLLNVEQMQLLKSSQHNNVHKSPSSPACTDFIPPPAYSIIELGETFSLGQEIAELHLDVDPCANDAISSEDTVSSSSESHDVIADHQCKSLHYMESVIDKIHEDNAGEKSDEDSASDQGDANVGSVSGDEDVTDVESTDEDFGPHENFVAEYMTETLGLPPPHSVSYIFEGGFNYTFKIEYSPDTIITNNGRSKSSSPLKTAVLPQKMVFRAPWTEFKMAMSPNLGIDEDQATRHQDLRDIAARNVVAGQKWTGLGGPVIFAYACNGKLPFFLMEFLEGDNLEAEFDDLSERSLDESEQLIYPTLASWVTHDQCCQHIVFSKFGSVGAHYDFPNSDWPLFREDLPCNAFQSGPETPIIQLGDDHFHHSLFGTETDEMLFRAVNEFEGPHWCFYEPGIKTLREICEALKGIPFPSNGTLYNLDPHPRNIMIERIADGSIKTFRRIDFDDFMILPPWCVPRSPWAIISQCPAFTSLKWSDDQLAAFEEAAMNLVLKSYPKMDASSINFNDQVVYEFVFLLKRDFRYECEEVFKDITKLTEVWQDTWAPMFQAGWTPYTGYQDKTSNNSNALTVIVSEICTCE